METTTMEWLLDPQVWLALVTLTALEIVLGIDNIVFITILVGRLPAHRQQKARIIGLGLAMVTRILLLLCLTWIMGLNRALFSVFGHSVSGRDLILLGGGLFLLFKSTHEIHESLEGMEGSVDPRLASTFGGILAQIALLDIVFSLDSVITAVGLARDLWVMVTAIVIAVGVMLFAAAPIGRFVEAHPTFKMLALSFLILIGVTLIADGLGFHVPKGYIYFAMAFSVGVEILNLKIRGRAARPVHLRKPISEATTVEPEDGR
jgi:predicted tellurium resistance membrane protein TerC